MMTKAEECRQSDRENFSDAVEYFEALEKLDPDACVQRTDMGAVVLFTDGSKYLLRRGV